MTALPFEYQDDETRTREEARQSARAILRGRVGVIRTLGAEALRSLVTSDASVRVGVAGSPASED